MQHCLAHSDHVHLALFEPVSVGYPQRLVPVTWSTVSLPKFSLPSRWCHRRCVSVSGHCTVRQLPELQCLLLHHWNMLWLILVGVTCPCVPAEDVRWREGYPDPSLGSHVPLFNDLDAVLHGVLVGEVLPHPLAVLVEAALPLLNVGDVDVWRSNTENNLCAYLRVCLCVPNAKNWAISPCRCGAYDR